jgi:hypothetical protein
MCKRDRRLLRWKVRRISPPITLSLRASRSASKTARCGFRPPNLSRDWRRKWTPPSFCPCKLLGKLMPQHADPCHGDRAKSCVRTHLARSRRWCQPARKSGTLPVYLTPRDATLLAGDLQSKLIGGATARADSLQNAGPFDRFIASQLPRWPVSCSIAAQRNLSRRCASAPLEPSFKRTIRAFTTTRRIRSPGLRTSAASFNRSAIACPRPIREHLPFRGRPDTPSRRRSK